MIIIVLLALVMAQIFYTMKVYEAMKEQDPIDAIIYICSFIINAAALIYVIKLFCDFFGTN